jgi:hypothetical protein
LLSQFGSLACLLSFFFTFDSFGRNHEGPPLVAFRLRWLLAADISAISDPLAPLEGGGGGGEGEEEDKGGRGLTNCGWLLKQNTVPVPP